MFGAINPGDLISPIKAFYITIDGKRRQHYEPHDIFTMKEQMKDFIIVFNTYNRYVLIFKEDFDKFELFKVGIAVDCRKLGSDDSIQWIKGIIQSTSPLKVDFDIDWLFMNRSKFDIIRKTKNALDIGEKIQYINDQHEWHDGVVMGLYPIIALQINDIGDFGFFSLDQIRKKTGTIQKIINLLQTIWYQAENSMDSDAQSENFKQDSSDSQ